MTAPPVAPPAIEPSMFQVWAELVIPAAGSIATMFIGVVSIWVAWRSHSLAREADARAEASELRTVAAQERADAADRHGEAVELVREVTEWSRGLLTAQKLWAPRPESDFRALEALQARLEASNVPNAESAGMVLARLMRANADDLLGPGTEVFAGQQRLIVADVCSALVREPGRIPGILRNIDALLVEALDEGRRRDWVESGSTE